jgi:hypothetical protein
MLNGSAKLSGERTGIRGASENEEYLTIHSMVALAKLYDSIGIGDVLRG